MATLQTTRAICLFSNITHTMQALGLALSSSCCARKRFRNSDLRALQDHISLSGKKNMFDVDAWRKELFNAELASQS